MHAPKSRVQIPNAYQNNLLISRNVTGHKAILVKAEGEASYFIIYTNI